MTGNDILKRALLLLGYNDHNGSTAGETAIRVRGIEVINTVLYELCKHQPLDTLEAEITAGADIADAAVYGVSMLIANGEGDGVRAPLFTEIYNLKRANIKAKSNRTVDVLPVCGG